MKKKVFVALSVGVLLISAVVLGVFFLDKDNISEVSSLFTETRQTSVTADAEYGASVYEKMLTVESDFDNMVEGTDYTANQIILAYGSETERQALESTLDSSGASVLNEIMDGVLLVEVPKGTNTQAYYQTLQSALGTVAAQPNYIYHVSEDTTYNIDSYLNEQGPRFYTGEKDTTESAAEAAGTVSAQDTNVDYVSEDDGDVETPNDPLLSSEWHLGTIDAYDAWEDLSGFSSGSGVTVAILDTGVDLRHLDLKTNIVGGVCYTGENTTGQDNHGHGTHVAGIVAATANNSIGVSGVAPGASLLAVKVLDGDGNGSSENVVQGINYAVSAGADVINMSLSSPNYDALLDTAITNAVNAGAVVVCAAGNASSSSGSWPSDCEDAISVTSTDQNDDFSSFSNYGDDKDIAAPGEDIMSSVYSKTYTKMSGTSMACPTVAGVAALLLQADGTLSVNEVKDILYDSADDLGATGKDIYYGNGLVNAKNAVMLALDIGEEESAYAISNEKEVQSTIDYEADTDWFSYVSEDNTDILLSVEGLDAQALDIDIYSSDMNAVVSTTPAVSQQYSFSAVGGETYYICAAGYSGSTGDYSIISYQDSIGDTKYEAALIATDNYVGSYIETSGDIDAFEVYTQANSSIAISLDVLDSTKSAMMVIDDAEGNRLYTGTEGSEGDSFEKLCDTESSLLVYVTGSTDLSPYSLNLNRDTNGVSIASSVTIDVDDKISGSLESGSDVDYFIFEPTTTREYYFNSIGNTDVAVILYDSNGAELASNDDIENPNQKGLYYYNCGVSYTLTAGATYYYALQSFVGDTGKYAVALSTYDPEVEWSIPDGSVRTFYRTYYGLTKPASIPTSVLLMTDYISVSNLTYTVNMTMAKNLDTLHVYNSPSVEDSDLDSLDNYQYLEYVVFSGTEVTEFPALSDWESVRYFEISDSEVKELPDWSSSSNLYKVNAAGNYIDFSEGSVSDVNADAMEAAGIEVVKGKQESLNRISLTSSIATPKTYEDTLLNATAYSTIVNVDTNAVEYKLEASYKGGDWTTISDWGEGTLTWYPDAPGSWRIRASARIGGNEEDTGITAIKYITATNPDEIDTGRVEITGVTKDVVLAGESITLNLDVNTDDLPERYELEYRLLYSMNGSSWYTVSGYDWEEYPEAGVTELPVTVQTATVDITYDFMAQIRVKGVTLTKRYDSSNEETVKSYAVMPLGNVTLTGVGDDEAKQVVPGEGILLTASAENRAGYDETPTYLFSYRMQGTSAWVPIIDAALTTTDGTTTVTATYSKNSSILFTPLVEGIYYFKVQAMSEGRSYADVTDYNYQGYTLYNYAEPTQAVYNLSANKKEYVNGEMVTLNLNLNQNSNEDNVEYQLMYSTNGSAYALLQDYKRMVLAVGESYDAIIKVPVLPTVSVDTIYYVKVLVRTADRTSVSDAYAVTKVKMMTAYPVEDGEVEMVSVGNDSDQQTIGTGIVLTATTRDNTQYRFAYQMEGNSRWYYVKGAWSDKKSIVFAPRKEGRYKFRVEAQTKTRTTIDTVSSETDYFGLYKSVMGAKAIEVATDTTALVNDTNGNELDITYSAEGNGTDKYQIRFLYSTNGRTFKALEDWTTSADADAVTDVAKTLTLPSVRANTTYTIKAEIRTLERTTADTFGLSNTVDVDIVAPLTSIDTFVCDDDDGIKVLPERTDGLTLEAVANDDATYKFYYRLEGTTRWSTISSRDVTGNIALFKARREGAYEFKVEAIAEGRKTRTADVSQELGRTVYIYLVSEAVESVDMLVVDDDYDYIIGTDTEMTLHLEADGNEAGMEYQVLYSANGGRSYKVLSKWQTLTENSNFDGEVSCVLPRASRDIAYYIKTQVRSVGRKKMDVESEAQEIWMLKEEREVTTELEIVNDVYEYTDTISANIAISDSASGDVEYRLQYSTNGKKWVKLDAHSWTEYDDGGTGSIDVNLNLEELNGENTVYIKLIARLKNSTKIEDFAVDSFDIYNIAPVLSASLTAIASGDEYITLTTTTEDGGYNNEKEYQYYYALAGQKRTSWIAFTSWITSDEITYSTSDSGDYMFKVTVRSLGRSTTDVAAKATNDDAGYYLKSLDDMALLAITEEPKASASPTPEASPSTSPSASASQSASASPNTNPSASASASPSASASQAAKLTSLEYAQLLALGEGAKISTYTETEVAVEELLGVIALDEAPVVIVQLGEDAYAVITGYVLDETDALVGLTLTDQTEEIMLGGTEDILRAWYYLPALEETEASATPTVAPSAEPEVSTTPEPTPDASPALPQAS